MLLKNINNKKIRNGAIYFVAFLFTIFILYILRISNVYSNEDIIFSIKNHFKIHRKYTIEIVNIIMNDKYSYKFSVHYHHGRDHLIFSDSVPQKLDSYLTQHTPIDFNDYVIRYYPNNICKFEYWRILNKNRHHPCLIYSFVDDADLFKHFSNCRLYFPPKTPIEDCQWLYKLEDNWYIYSP